MIRPLATPLAGGLLTAGPLTAGPLTPTRILPGLLLVSLLAPLLLPGLLATAAAADPATIATAAAADPATIATAAAADPATIATAATHATTTDPAIRVYWTEWRSYNPTLSRIARAPADGGSAETLLTGFHHDTGLGDLAIDTDAGKLYWANRPADLIECANLDGTARDTVLADVNAVGLALDLAGGKIYWADYTYSDPRIRRADLDGTDVQDLVSASDGCQLEGLVLDLAAGKLYWAERMDQQIWRANLDGSGAQRILECWQGIGHPWGLALAGGRIYWPTGESIMSATLDGDDVTTVIDDLPDAPRSLEIDHAAGRLYWVTGDMSGAMVQRMNLDGTGLQTLVEGLYYGYGLALEYAAAVPVPDTPTASVHLRSHPNPFNPHTTLAFDLPRAGPVTLAVIAADGTRVRTLMQGWRAAGHHEVAWDGRDASGRAVASGVYLCHLTGASGTTAHAVTLVR